MSGLWDTAVGVWDDYVVPTAHVAGGIAEAAGAHTRAIPYVGAAIGLVQAAYHGYQATQTEGDERWDHIGAATLGALGAIPAVGAYVGAGELGWNIGAAAATGGMHNAHEAGGNANQMVGGLMRAAINDDYSVGNVTDRRDHFWETH